MSTELSAKTIEYLEQQSQGRARRRAATVFLSTAMVIAIGAGAYFGYTAWQKRQSDALAAELAKDFRGPGAREKIDAAIKSGQVSEDQMREAGRAEWDRREREQLDGYFALPPDQRDAYLDKIIDEFEKNRERWRQNRPQTRPTSRPAEERSSTTRPERSPEERAQRQQERMDSQSPADRARRAEFRSAMMKRMQERGISFGRGGWGGGGRGGGGRGR